ncbi:Hypothetical protein GLP15_3593 [Giardia lamblia P15]|uniref:Uncharacterized protein n=1 Tax=Giardia intestinalis (strain P15) TaxID=658858 RepID=E1F4E0_GIAIA|nr:Hypothetical protein GLP15_3593 [Giardia lamblia P15]
MKSISSEPTDALEFALPISEIEDLVKAKDIISLVSKPYFTAAIRSLYPLVMDLMDDQDIIQQVMMTVYYQENQSESVLQAVRTNLISAFQDCGAGSIALAELVFKHPIVLNRTFQRLTKVAILDTENMILSFEKLNTPSTRYFFEVVTAVLSSFALRSEHLELFINHLLMFPASFDGLVSLSGYSCFQTLLEMLFIVKFNRTTEVASKIASAWREGGMGSRMLKYLICSFSYKNRTVTCVDLTRGIADFLVKGLLMDIDYIVESTLEAIPKLTEIIMFSDQSAPYMDLCDFSDHIHMKADAFRSLVDLWICAVRCLMTRLHQNAVSIYSYQDSPTYTPGTIITILDMKQRNIFVVDIFYQFINVLQSGDFSVTLVGDYMYPPLLHLTLQRLTAVARLLCVAGDIRNFHYFKTRGYYPPDYFMDPENTHSTTNHQIGKIYGALPPTAHLTIIGSDDVPIEELCQTDNGAIIEASMLGIVRALLQTNVHTFVNCIFSSLSNDLQCFLSLCTAIDSLLLEYRFMIPQLTEQVLANEHTTTLFSDTLRSISSLISYKSNVKMEEGLINGHRLRLPLKTVFVCSFVQNLYKMLGNEGDRKQLIGKRMLSLQNIKISFTSESQQQKRGLDPLAPFLGEGSLIHRIFRHSSPL